MAFPEELLFGWGELAASIATVVALGFVALQLYLVKKEQKQTEKIMQYENSPFLTPYMVRKKTKDSSGKEIKGPRFLHIKNIGRGSAVRIHYKICLTKELDPSINKNDLRLDEPMATFAFDAESFNTKISLEKGPIEFIFKAKYSDILNKCYYINEKYLFDMSKPQIKLFEEESSREIFETEQEMLKKYPNFPKCD